MCYLDWSVVVCSSEAKRKAAAPELRRYGIVIAWASVAVKPCRRYPSASILGVAPGSVHPEHQGKTNRGGAAASRHHRRFHRMKLRLIAVAVAALTLTAGQAFAQDTSSEKGKLSYALGYDLGRNAVESGEALDVNTIVKGLQDGYAKKEPAVPAEKLRGVEIG